MTTPKAFLSYSWDDEAHKEWVAELAAQLRTDGVETILDQWHAAPGDQLPAFMEREIRENDYVLVICTPRYRAKSNGREGGVGYEGDIMTAEVHTRKNHRKFVPILARGTWTESAPSWLAGKYYVDLSNPVTRERNYSDLTATLLGRRPKAPPVRQRATAPHVGAHSSVPSDPIQIVGVIADEVTEPRNDGSPGSALYSIPFQLNRTPSARWSSFFVQTWDAPPRYTTMHRFGIASVRGDRIVLNGTTIEEVKSYHRETLALCVEEANKREAGAIARAMRVAEEKQRRSDQHRQDVRDIAGGLRFHGDD